MLLKYLKIRVLIQINIQYLENLVLINFTEYNREDNYIKTNLSYIGIYFKQIEKLNLIAKKQILTTIRLITKTKISITANLITKTKILIVVNLIAKIKLSTTINLIAEIETIINLLAIINRYQY